MKNLLITGGTGFFGRALLRYLEYQRNSTGGLQFDMVTVMSRSPKRFLLRYPSLANLPWLHWHSGDVLDPSTLPQHATYQFIIHAASDSTDAAGLTPLQSYRQIVDGTENMLKFSKICGANRFLFTSSGGAYGPQPEEIQLIPETYSAMPDPLNPFNFYGVAKRQAEHLCAQYGYLYGFETVVARCFAFVGEDLPRNAHFAVGNFIRDATERSEIIINGNGHPIRSYMYQSDLANWLLTILQHGAPGNAYNVGSEEAYTISEVAHIVRDTLAPEKQVKIKSNNISGNSLRNRYVPDVTKAKMDLGLVVSVPLVQAIKLSVS